MQKWHIHYAIARGGSRPAISKSRSTLLFSCHYIYTNAPRRQESSPATTRKDPSSRFPPNGTKRREAAPSSIEGIWRANAPRNSQQLGGVPLSKSVIERSDLDGSSAGMRLPRRRGANPPVDARDLGARPEDAHASYSKEILGGRTSDGTHAGAIDARSLGARPGTFRRLFPTGKILSGTSDGADLPVVDARSLRARPEGSKRSFPTRNDLARTSDGADPPAVDARSLGARPEGSKRSFPTRNVLARTSDGADSPAVDARSLGASIGEAQRPLLRKQVLDSRPETRGSSGRSQFQFRYPRDGDGDESHPSTNMGSLQQRSVGGKNRFPQPKDSDRYTGARAERAPQTHQIRPRRSQPNFSGRAMGGEGRSAQPRRIGPKGPRAGRGSDDSEPKPRKRDVEENFDLSNINYLREANWTAEERQYLKEKKERESGFKVRMYEPEKQNKEMFVETAPATASDELGLSSMLEERLLLATKYLNHEFIQWESKEQKADVMAVVEKLKAVSHEGNPEGDVAKTESASPELANGDEQAQSLMQKLIAGEYAAFRKLGENDILGHVERHVHRNDSFYPEDEKSLLKKVRSIMPVPKVGGGARNEVKA